MGVGEDFSIFKDNYNITTDLISSISNRYKRITRQLNTDFWNTDSDTAHSLYVGSYGRDTAANLAETTSAPPRQNCETPVASSGNHLRRAAIFAEPQDVS
jgi:hypothetical protein